MSFKPNPYANPSVGAPTPTGYNISGAERLAAGALTTGTNPIHSAADTTLAAAQFTDKGIEVSDGSVVRVVLGDLGGGSYGLKLYQSDGSTAIIDGSSDMFRISASGTRSVVTNNGDRDAVAEVTLTGLGTLSESPGHLSYMATSLLTSDKRGLGTQSFNVVGTDYTASTSGGAANFASIRWNSLALSYVYLNGSSQAVFGIRASNQSGGTFTVQCRYYVLAQAAI